MRLPRSSQPSFKNKNILITLGPTREHLDPVRYLSNGSSGKMGLALARRFKALGARVTLVAGPGVPQEPGMVRSDVLSAREMLGVVRKKFSRCDVFVSVAAVADYRPAYYSRAKIAKNKSALSLRLVPNPDILAEMGLRKKNQVVVGFALQNSVQNLTLPLRKMREKRCNMLVVNSVESMDSEKIRAKIIFAGGGVLNLGTISKEACASKICQAILQKAKF